MKKLKTASLSYNQKTMYPNLLNLYGFELKTYTLFSLLASIGALLVVEFEARKLNWDKLKTFSLVFNCTLVGFVGAHIMYALTRLDLDSKNWWPLFYNFGYGFVWFGGFLSAIPICLRYSSKNKIPQTQVFAVAAIAVLAAQTIGRIGCFFGGCCYGIPTEFILGIEYPSHEYGLKKLHATALYESLYQLLILITFIYWREKKGRNKHNDIMLIGIYLTLVPAGRFLLEFLRGDKVRGIYIITETISISTSQIIALPLIFTGIVIIFKQKYHSEAFLKS